MKYVAAFLFLWYIPALISIMTLYAIMEGTWCPKIRIFLGFLFSALLGWLMVAFAIVMAMSRVWESVRHFMLRENIYNFLERPICDLWQRPGKPWER